MDPLIVCFYNWLLIDINWNYELTQAYLVAYVTNNYEYLKENNYIKVMTLPKYVAHINTSEENEYPEAICLISEELHNKLLKTIL